MGDEKLFSIKLGLEAILLIQLIFWQWEGKKFQKEPMRTPNENKLTA